MMLALSITCQLWKKILTQECKMFCGALYAFGYFMDVDTSNTSHNVRKLWKTKQGHLFLVYHLLRIASPHTHTHTQTHTNGHKHPNTLHIVVFELCKQFHCTKFSKRFKSIFKVFDLIHNIAVVIVPTMCVCVRVLVSNVNLRQNTFEMIRRLEDPVKVMIMPVSSSLLPGFLLPISLFALLLLFIHSRCKCNVHQIVMQHFISKILEFVEPVFRMFRIRMINVCVICSNIFLIKHE